MNIHVSVGDIFGRLTVVQRDTQKSSKRHWICRCECGTVTSVRSDHLRMVTRSCGCIAREKISRVNLKPAGDSSFGELWCRYKRNARTGSHEWLLSKELARELFEGTCFYCGCAPKQVVYRKNANGKFTYNGIDRSDNTKGYIPGNVVSCCWPCNNLKRAFSLDDFLARVRTIYEYRISKMCAGAAP